MGRFLTSERHRQADLRSDRTLFSKGSEGDGRFGKHTYPFCLPVEAASENLFEEVRHQALALFTDNGIRWHSGTLTRPSNHLCDSQVCCVNFLMPLAGEPDALKSLLEPVFGPIDEVLPVNGSGLLVDFEVIGEKNYLGEKGVEKGRTRGANFTSADAAVKFRRADGAVVISLIEWKYTESYAPTDMRIKRTVRSDGSVIETDRREVYRHLWEREDCPIARGTDYDAVFCEPFYQFMRQQMLAKEMERAREDGADEVHLLHISPAANLDFRRVTSPTLASLGDSATSVWSKLTSDSGRFHAVDTEMLFREVLRSALIGDRASRYLLQRYGWVSRVR